MLVHESFLDSLPNVLFRGIVTEFAVNIVTYFSVRDYDNLLFTWHRYFSFAYWHDANFIFSRMLLSASGFSSMYLAISAGNSFLPFAAKSKNLSLVSLLACSISIAFN